MPNNKCQKGEHESKGKCIPNYIYRVFVVIEQKDTRTNEKKEIDSHELNEFNIADEAYDFLGRVREC